MKKKIKLLIVILLIIIIIGLCYYYFNEKQSDKNSNVKVIKEISKFEYSLKENQTKLYEKKFNELKDILSEDNIDYIEYAKKISEMFIIDFYTLDNKLSKNDIGGLQFIKDNMKDNFIDQARNTFYRYINVKSGNRNQQLPIVKSITDVDALETKFVINDKITSKTSKIFKRTTKGTGKEVDAYKVSVKWDYEKDLGYETSANMILIREGNKLYIVEMN